MGLTTSSCKKIVQKPNNQPRISGKYEKRPKQRTRNNDITMATWNVRTVLQPGKMQEVAQEMIRYKIDVKRKAVFQKKKRKI
jgi:hypothetical protein